MKKILFLICILFLVVGCDVFSPKPVTYHVYVMDKWLDTVEYTSTHFIHTGKATIPITSHHTRVDKCIKFRFWNMEEPLSKMSEAVYVEDVGDAYYKSMEKHKTYMFNQNDEYILGLRKKERIYKIDNK